MKLRILSLFVLLSLMLQTQAREIISLNDNWRSVCYPEGRQDSLVANRLTLPHNWDDYFSYRLGMQRSALYGTCHYDRVFTVSTPNNESVFLRLEGAGSYITITLNGQEVCKQQPAGMVVTTIDITPYLYSDRNRISIICEHPSNADDLPWIIDPTKNMGLTNVPFGLFRNVSLEVTSAVRIEPFGVHAWPNETLDTLYVETEVRNYSTHPAECRLNTAFESLMAHKTFMLGAQLTEKVVQKFAIGKFNLDKWTLENPKTYNVSSMLMLGYQQVLADKVDTPIGLNTIKWPKRNANGELADNDHRFYLNGKPLLLNGTNEVEHNFGNSFAFTQDECTRRIKVAKYMGYNAFCDFNAPHNLTYLSAIESEGMFYYPVFSAHVWNDTPAFRSNFKKMLAQWVKERRNSPSIILWGIQNENILPADFVRECRQLIRELDPRPMRLITTSSTDTPSEGADWHLLYEDTVLPTYGFERTAGDEESESKFCEQLHAQMSKMWKNRDSMCGQFHDALFSYPTPGKGKADHKRVIDQVGPFANRGIFNAFWEPTDAYYLYVAWGDFLQHVQAGGGGDPTTKSARDMVIYGYHFDDIPLPDYLQKHDNQSVRRSYAKNTQVLLGESDRTYLYRINCGGDEVTDSHGQIWKGDDSRFAYNWSQAPQYEDDKLNPVLASQAVVPGLAMIPTEKDEKAPWAAREDQDLLRTYRWGRHDLKYTFPVPTGKIYQVDVYFVNTRHFVHHVSYKTRADNKGILTVNFKNIKIGQQKIAAIAISAQRLDANDFGSADRRGNFTWNSSTLDKLRKLSPAHFRSAGYPYSAGLTWKELMDK